MKTPVRSIVVAGKGGVGKTTVAALIARHLALHCPELRTLLVDADHATGLGIALSIEPAETLNDVRVASLAELRARETSRQPDLAAGVDYRLLSALAERDHLAFLALGRPEDDGCFCAVNTVLKRALELLTGDFDLTLIDAEAGLEQINRDVVGRVDVLLLVADGSLKSIRVAEAAREVAERVGTARDFGLVFNRVRPEDDPEALRARTSLPVLGFLPDDATVRAFDAEARSFFELPDGPAPSALQPILDALGLVR